MFRFCLFVISVCLPTYTFGQSADRTEAENAERNPPQYACTFDRRLTVLRAVGRGTVISDSHYRVRVRKGGEADSRLFGKDRASMSKPTQSGLPISFPVDVDVFLCGTYPSMKIERVVWSINVSQGNVRIKASGEVEAAERPIYVNHRVGHKSAGWHEIYGEFVIPNVPVSREPSQPVETGIYDIEVRVNTHRSLL